MMNGKGGGGGDTREHRNHDNSIMAPLLSPELGVKQSEWAYISLWVCIGDIRNRMDSRWYNMAFPGSQAFVFLIFYCYWLIFRTSLKVILSFSFSLMYNFSHCTIKMTYFMHLIKKFINIMYNIWLLILLFLSKTGSFWPFTAWY